MSQASEVELLMLDLINEERVSRGLDPLEINTELNDSSEDHSQWMLDTNTFSHTGVDGSSSRERIENADYELEGSWGTAENIAWQSERGEAGIADDVASLHQSLMNSPSHRANILNPDLEDIGIGVVRGEFSTSNGTFDSVMVTQNFGRTEAVSEEPESEVPPVIVGEEPATPEPEPIPDPEPDVPVAETPMEEEPSPEPTTPDVVVMDPSDPGAFFDFADFFDFTVPTVISDATETEDTVVNSVFQGSIDTSQGIITTDSPAEFAGLLADMFATVDTMSFYDFV